VLRCVEKRVGVDLIDQGGIYASPAVPSIRMMWFASFVSKCRPLILLTRRTVRFRGKKPVRGPAVIKQQLQSWKFI